MLDRKPQGYWKDIENVKKDLQSIIDELERLPTKTELDDTGRSSLAAAIKKYGGGSYLNGLEELNHYLNLPQEKEKTGKICNGCDRDLPFKNFNYRSDTKDFVETQCKECRAAKRQGNKISEPKYDGAKICDTCDVEKNIEEYHIDRSKLSDGRATTCRECYNSSRRISDKIYLSLDTKTALTEKKALDTSITVSNFEVIKKPCKVCDRFFDSHSFEKNKNMKHGTINVCKECRAEARVANAEKAKLLPPPEYKVCTTCKNNLPIEKFSKDSSRDNSFCYSCKDCKLLADKKRNSDPEYKKMLNVKKKEYYDKNIDMLRENARKYYFENFEEIAEKRKQHYKTEHGRWTAFIASTNSRTKIVALGGVKISEVQHCELIQKNCAYCNAEPNPLNGIDRIDSNIGYEIDNCVPACAQCNYMKNDLTLTDFNEHLRQILKYQEDGIKDIRIPEQDVKKKLGWNLSLNGRYYSYLESAKKRNKKFDINLDYFSKFWQKNCEYCGEVNDTIGLDRIDNNIGYIPGNIISCCYNCNSMKMDLTVDEFFGQCRKIVDWLNFDDNEAEV